MKIVSWLWAQPGGRAIYTAHHVNVWADMVRRHLSMPHQLACVTAMPEGIDPSVEIIRPTGEFEDIVLPGWKGTRPQCLRRLALFRRDAADIFGAERIVSMDLDVVACGPLDPLFAGGEDFRICRGTHGSRPFNGSLVMLKAGARAEVHEKFNAREAIVASRKYVGSDQSWLMFTLGRKGEATWGPEDGVVAWQAKRLCRSPRLVVYPGGTKPDKLAEMGDAFAGQHYRRSPAGRCLVLGYGALVWDDASLELARGYDAVIASPEAAKHWPGAVLAIAEDDAHAERLAAVHGFNDVAWCGRSAVGVPV